MPTEPKGPPAKPPTAPQGGAKAAGGIKGGLTRKVGPLPVWGWAAVAGGAFVAWTFLRGGSSGEDQGAYGVAGLGSLAGGGGGAGGYGGSGADGGSGGALGVGDTAGDVAAQLPPGPTGTGAGAAVQWAQDAASKYLPGSDQAAALADPNAVYAPAEIKDAAGNVLGGNIVETTGAADTAWTPNTARAFWDRWIANPFDLSKIAPAQLPGSLVLSPAELAQVQAINDAGNLPAAPAGFDPNIYVASGFTDVFDMYPNILNPQYSASGSPPAITSLPIGNITPIPAPSPTPAPVNYSGAIADLKQYIVNLNTGTVTQADRDKIALYEARIKEYEAR